MNLAQSSNLEMKKGVRVAIDPKWAKKKMLPFEICMGLIYITLISMGFMDNGITVGLTFTSIITFLILYALTRYLKKIVNSWCIIYWNDRTVFVRYQFISKTLEKKDKQPVKISRSKNGRNWIIGEGTNFLKTSRVSVPVAAFPDLEIVYNTFLEQQSVLSKL